MISNYGENAQFICDKCNDSITSTATGSTHRLANGNIKIKSPNTSETDYREFANIPSKLNATPTKDTTVVNAIRYFEEKKQQQPSHKISKLNENDGHFTIQGTGKNNISYLINLFYAEYSRFYFKFRIYVSKKTKNPYK
jgi:hypothetical protein